jgi:hypothetical protein
LREAAPILVHDDVDMRPVVEASAFEVAIVEREAQRSYEVEADVRSGTQVRSAS